MRFICVFVLATWSLFASAEEPTEKSVDKSACFPNVERDPPSPMSVQELEKIRELNATLKEIAQKRNVQLDYSDESIEWLDGNLTKNRERMKQENAARGAMLFGSYLGETIARRFKGEWVLVGQEPAVLVNGKALLFPMGQVLNHLTLGAQCSVGEYYKALPGLLAKKS
jgi:hypothetical protein